MANIVNFISSKFSDIEISKLSEIVLSQELNLEELNNNELNDYILFNLKSIDTAEAVGMHRKEVWSKGWSGDGIYKSNDQYNNLPYYFYKNKFVRFNNKVYRDINGFGEFHLLRILQNLKLNIAIKNINFNSIIEYGCGTGHNIEFFKKILGNKYEYYGADWVESSIENLIRNQITRKENSFVVNYFDNKTYRGPKNNYLAVTVASLEQTGDKFKEFINYLIKNESCVGAIHIEPIKELLNRTNKLEDLSYKYMEKRNYLSGFLEYLKGADIQIIDVDDKSIGSTFIQGYQSVVWKKI
jgi:hypothetical protein